MPVFKTGTFNHSVTSPGEYVYSITSVTGTLALVLYYAYAG